jgi:hypothetical protein
MSEQEEIIAVRRAPRFSPNSVDRDDAILHAVCDELKQRLSLTAPIPVIDEDDFAKAPAKAKVYVTMARSEAALQALTRKTEAGALCINSAMGVRQCQRVLLTELMRYHHIPMPAEEGKNGTWLKRGDAAAQSKGDVVFCPDHEALLKAIIGFTKRGINEYVTSAHVEGDLVKFYGVGRRFFRYYYPTDDGFSKFGDEQRNGTAQHYPFDEDALRKDAFRLAEITGVTAYGGDAIVDERGQYFFIDFNDWPSFSRCREEAARAIAEEIIAQGKR